MRLHYSFPTLALALLFSCTLFAQPGEFDDSFGDGGIAYTNAWGSVHPSRIKVLANGDMVLAGFQYPSWSDPGQTRIIRLTSEGTWIDSFGQNGVVTVMGTGSNGIFPSVVVEQPDGKLLFALNRGVGFNDSRQVLLRVTPAGEPDETFGVNGMVENLWGNENATHSSMVLDAQGRILVAGRRAYTAGNWSQSDGFVMRLLPDGSLDPSFGTNGIYSTGLMYNRSEIYSIRVLPDGKLLLSGSSYHDVQGVSVVMKLQQNGSPDTGFGQQGVIAHGLHDGRLLFPYDAVIHTDGRIVAGGVYYNMDGTYSTRIGSMGLLPDGSLDPGYGDGGHALLEAGPGWGEDQYTMAVLEDEDAGILYVTMISTPDDSEYHYFLARQFANGQADETFGEGGLKELALPEGTNLTISADFTADGKLITLGANIVQGVGVIALIARLQPTATFASIPEVPEFLSGLSLFPNPVADNFTLAFQHEGDGPLRIELMDLQGRLVHRFAERVFVQGEQRLELAWPASAAQGAYVLTIVGGQGRATVPLVR